MAAVECHAHPGTIVASTCSICLKPLCTACLVFDRFRPACAPCAKTARTQRRRMTWIYLAVGMVAVCTGTVAIVAGVAFYEPPPPPFDYGRFADDVTKLQSQLQQEPCDRTKIVTLGETMAKAGDYRGAIRRSEEFFAACGEHHRLLWVTYGAKKRLGEWDEAIKDATKLIESDPSDKDYWWWRGICHEERGRLVEAAADYEKSLEAEPRLTSIPFNLAAIYERLGRQCDAAKVVERYLVHHPESADNPSVKQRLERHREHCEPSVDL